MIGKYTKLLPWMRGKGLMWDVNLILKKSWVWKVDGNQKSGINSPVEGTVLDLTIWMFPKIVGSFPPNHPLNNRVFHYFHHPFWGTTIFGNTYLQGFIHFQVVGNGISVVECPLKSRSILRKGLWHRKKQHLQKDFYRQSPVFSSVLLLCF